MSKPKVFWTVEEKRALIAECVAIVRAGEVSSQLAALNLAQGRVLPEDRRRKVLSVSLLSWLVDGIRLGLLQPEEPPEQEPSREPEVPSLANLWQQLRPILVNELASLITDALQQAQTGPQRDFGRELTLVPRPERLKRPSVLVIGLRGGQRTEIEREFSGSLDLRFFTVDESKDKLRQVSGMVDVVVGFTDFISHSHEACAQARAKRYMRSGGGMTRLKQTLQGLAAERRAA